MLSKMTVQTAEWLQCGAYETGAVRAVCSKKIMTKKVLKGSFPDSNLNKRIATKNQNTTCFQYGSDCQVKVTDWAFSSDFIG